MKKLLLVLAIVLLGNTTIAQEKTYLLFEFMKVDNEQESAYAETEDFWEKIHAQRVKNGDIVGWDLWSLQPGGESQGFQYMTVNVYNDPVKMFSGAGDFNAALKGAYPDMSEEELNKAINKSGQTRDLAIRLYLEVVKSTTGDFTMDLGTVAYLDFMKATGGSSAYEKAEIETFLPMHQNQVDAGAKGSWQLIRVMSPTGSEAYTSHITVNMFTGFDQVFNSPPDNSLNYLSEEAIKGIETRDMKSTSIATLIKKVR